MHKGINMFGLKVCYNNKLEVESEIEYDIINNGKLFLLQSVEFLVMGFIALFIGIMGGKNAIHWLGLILMVHGIIKFLFLCKVKGYWLIFLSTIANSVIGYIIYSNSYMDLYTFSIFISLLFAIKAVAELIFAINAAFVCRYNWVLRNGVISLIISLVAVPGIMSYGVVFAGFIIAISLIFRGIAARGIFSCVSSQCEPRKA